jgi:hypothetical protein
MYQQGQVIDIVMGLSPKSTKGECGAGEVKSGLNMVLRKRKQGKRVGAGNLPSSISSEGGVEKLGQKVRELSAEENAVAYKEFREFVQGVGGNDRRRAEALKALWSVCVRWGVPVALRLGGEVEGEESLEDYSEEEEEMEPLGRIQGLRLAAPDVCIGSKREEPKSGRATGAKMYLLLDKNINVGKRKEWLWRMRYGSEFKGMEKEKVNKLLEYLDWKRGNKEEEIVKVGMKRKVTTILRTGTVLEKERTEEREKKRVRIFLRTWSEFETDRMASIMAKEECSTRLVSNSENLSSDPDSEDEKTIRETGVESEEPCYVY